MKQQQLTEALEFYEAARLSDYDDRSFHTTLLAAARLVERLLPGECPRCQGTGQHSDPGMGGPKYYDLACRECREPWPQKRGTGQVWDEGIVEAVAKALFIEASSPGFAWISPTNMPEASFMRQARAVLSAITQLAEAGSR